MRHLQEEPLRWREQLGRGPELENYLPENGKYKRLIKGQCGWSTDIRGRMVPNETGKKLARDLRVHCLISHIRGKNSVKCVCA